MNGKLDRLVRSTHDGLSVIKVPARQNKKDNFSTTPALGAPRVRRCQCSEGPGDDVSSQHDDIPTGSSAPTTFNRINRTPRVHVIAYMFCLLLGWLTLGFVQIPFDSTNSTHDESSVFHFVPNDIVLDERLSREANGYESQTTLDYTNGPESVMQQPEQLVGRLDSMYGSGRPLAAAAAAAAEEESSSSTTPLVWNAKQTTVVLARYDEPILKDRKSPTHKEKYLHHGKWTDFFSVSSAQLVVKRALTDALKRICTNLKVRYLLLLLAGTRVTNSDEQRSWTPTAVSDGKDFASEVVKLQRKFGTELKQEEADRVEARKSVSPLLHIHSIPTHHIPLNACSTPHEGGSVFAAMILRCLEAPNSIINWLLSTRDKSDDDSKGNNRGAQLLKLSLSFEAPTFFINRFLPLSSPHDSTEKNHIY